MKLSTKDIYSAIFIHAKNTYTSLKKNDTTDRATWDRRVDVQYHTVFVAHAVRPVPTAATGITEAILWGLS